MIDVGLLDPSEMNVSQLTDDRRCPKLDLELPVDLHPITRLEVIMVIAFQETVGDLTTRHQLICSTADLSKIHHTDHLFGTNAQLKLRCLLGLEEDEVLCPHHRGEDEVLLQSTPRMYLRAEARDRLRRAHQDDILGLIPTKNPRYPLRPHRTQHLCTLRDSDRSIHPPTRRRGTLQLRFHRLSHHLQPDLVVGMRRQRSLPLDLHPRQEGRLRDHKPDHENRGPRDIPYLLSTAL
jgi:hypothetical protein